MLLLQRTTRQNRFVQLGVSTAPEMLAILDQAYVPFLALPVPADALYAGRIVGPDPAVNSNLLRSANPQILFAVIQEVVIQVRDPGSFRRIHQVARQSDQLAGGFVIRLHTETFEMPVQVLECGNVFGVDQGATRHFLLAIAQDDLGGAVLTIDNVVWIVFRARQDFSVLAQLCAAAVAVKLGHQRAIAAGDATLQAALHPLLAIVLRPLFVAVCVLEIVGVLAFLALGTASILAFGRPVIRLKR